MTDEQIIEALATRVMGWHRDPDSILWCDSKGKFMARKCEDWEESRNSWNPLTEAAAAESVRDRMKRLGYWYRMEWDWEVQNFDPAGGYVCGFAHRDSPRSDWDGYACEQTEKRACALAALRAHGVEV